MTAAQRDALREIAGRADVRGRLGERDERTDRSPCDEPRHDRDDDERHDRGDQQEGPNACDLIRDERRGLPCHDHSARGCARPLARDHAECGRLRRRRSAPRPAAEIGGDRSALLVRLDHDRGGNAWRRAGDETRRVAHGPIGGEQQQERLGARTEIDHDERSVAGRRRVAALQRRRGGISHRRERPVLLLADAVRAETREDQDEQEHRGRGDAGAIERQTAPHRHLRLPEHVADAAHGVQQSGLAAPPRAARGGPRS